MSHTQSQLHDLYEKAKNEQYIKLSLPFLNAFGAEESALLLYLEGLTSKNQREKQSKYYRDGHYWTRFTYKRLHARIGMGKSVRSLQRLVYSLESKGYLVSLAPDPNDFNPCKWYRVDLNKMIEFYLENDFTDLPPDDGMDDDGLDNFDSDIPILSRGGHDNLGQGIPILSRGEPIMENILDQQLDQKLKKKQYPDPENFSLNASAKRQLSDPCVGASESSLSYDSTAKKNGSANPEDFSLVKDPGFDEKKEIAPPTPPRKMPATQMLKGGMARKIHNEVVAIYLANKPEAWVGVPSGVPLGGLEKNEIAARIAEFEDEHGERGYEIFKDVLVKTLQGMQWQDDFYKNNKSIGLHSVLHKLTQYAGLVNIQVGSATESSAATPQNADPLARLSVEQNSVVFTALELATADLDIRSHPELTQPQKLKMCRDRQAAQSRLRKHLAGIISTLTGDILSDAKALAVYLASSASLVA